jgi:DNA-damage-inducible protein D
MDENLTIAALDETKRYTVSSVEYWRARDIQMILGYRTWENFQEAVKRAMRAVEKTGGDVQKHFRETTKMVQIGSGAQRSTLDYFIDRYGCYMTAMNGDPSIPQIAAAQRYFAIQTRRQEQRDAQDGLGERIVHRDRLSLAVKAVNEAASAVGVQNWAFWTEAGYLGLYELTSAEIKRKKGISEKETIYDRAGLAELAANAFHKTLTQKKLKGSGVHGQRQAEQVYKAVGHDVREVMRKHDSPMPEDMPPEPSLKKLESERKKQQKRLKAAK